MHTNWHEGWSAAKLMSSLCASWHADLTSSERDAAEKKAAKLRAEIQVRSGEFRRLRS